MHRIFLSLAALFAISTSVVAEEIVLKDGTRIVGRMSAISGDKIEVETAYGKMSVKRGDIVSISFAENGENEAPPAAARPKKASQIDESMDGTQYINKTGKFALTVPIEWKINPSLRLSDEVLAGLNSRDNMRFLVVTREEYPGSLESYAGLIEIQAKRNLQEYEKLSESPTTIDGKSALLVSYRGTSAKANNLPIQFISAIVVDGKNYSRITAWCVEPLFNETQPMFEKILSSYHSLPDIPSSSPASKP